MNLKKLRELAEKATPGPWVVKYRDKSYQAYHWVESEHGDLGEPEDGGGLGTSTPENAEYIAAANPVVMLKLLDVVEAAYNMNQSLQSLPWRRLSKTDDTLCLSRTPWHAWNYGVCQDLHTALEALDDSQD